MDTKIKIIGTREEVYKCTATRTAGGLQKNDIIEKKIGNKIMYISKKISEKMKENINILRIQNPNFLKKIQKKTIVNNQSAILKQEPEKNKHNMQNTQNTNNIQNKTKLNTHNKTQKLSFKVSDNEVKNVFYPELKGININELKQDLKDEEDEEDLGLNIKKTNSNNIFKIEELPDININELY
jgi:hypothetical protein